MRVLQLIDSLEAGGAERIAVTFANALSSHIEDSCLCVTRNEGILRSKVSHEVSYLFLNKKSTLDLSALFRLRKFVKQHKVDIVHAHTTSYFFATLLKIISPGIKLIWHEHHGKRVFTNRSKNKALYLCSFFFKKIITVNEDLQEWCKQHLATKKVVYLPNFVDQTLFSSEQEERKKQIVCLANLRVPKDHLNLLRAFKKVHGEFPDWELRLIGKDFEDSYSGELKEFVSEHGLKRSVFFEGAKDDIERSLQEARIGVLASESEGLPIALLEYGLARLAVVATNVGYCEKVISTFGKTVASKNSEALANALLFYIKNKENRILDADAFHKHIISNYSLKKVLPLLIEHYKDSSH